MSDKPRGMCEEEEGRRKEHCGEIEMTGPVFHIRALVPLQYVNILCLVNIKQDTRFNILNSVPGIRRVPLCFVLV
jgi:hypothetical protein